MAEELNSKTFQIEPADNGGFFVMVGSRMRGEYCPVAGAFTNPADMLRWLAPKLGLRVMVEQVKAEEPRP